MTNQRRIEDIYRLSPVQEGILYHTLEEPDSGMYMTQWLFELPEEPKSEALSRAAEQLLGRHGVLRTAFVWEGREHPVQAVLGGVRLPWEVHDWQEDSEAELDGRLEAFLIADRARGFDLKKPPLFRLTLFLFPDARGVLLWSFHHILLDGWSLQILMEEFSALYEEVLGAGPADLEEAPPFGEYISWLQHRSVGDAESFWRDLLRGIDRPTPIPLESRSGPQTNPEAYPQVDHMLSLESTRQIRDFLRKRHLTLATLIQGAWAVLLARYAGAEDVLFGATVSGRPAEVTGVETMVGVFINTLPVRVQCPPRADMFSWLADIQRLHAQIRESEHVPLREIHAWSEIPGSAPLFETFVNVTDLRASDERSETGLTVASARTVIQANYAVSLGVTFEPELNLRISFDAESFTPASVRRLQRRLRALLLDMTSGVDRPLESLSLMDAAEVQQILHEWSPENGPAPVGTVLRAIEQTADRAPESPALVMGEARLTYRELDRQANRWARHFRRKGVGPESPVALLLDRSIELFLAILGVWKAGGAYLVLEPTDPEERLRDILSRSGARHLVTTDGWPTGGLDVTLVDVVKDRPRLDSESSERLAGPLEDSLAYILYTSGSTGRPKGVAVEHRQLQHYVRSAVRALDLEPGMSYLLVSTPAADLGHTSVYGAWTTGGCLHVATRDEAHDPDLLARLFAHHSVDVMKIVPSHLSALVAAQPNPLPFPRKRLVVGGDATPKDAVERWKALAPNCRIFNHYGPTETTVGVVAGEISREEIMPEHTDTVPLGRGMEGVRLLVVDTSGRLVPMGIPGELWIGGYGVARGYVTEPGITSEKFIPDPFSRVAGARLYRTGDRVRWHSNGCLEFLGRIDHQVKVRGFRVELGEVEASLETHPGVERAVAMTQGSSPDVRLVAYVQRRGSDPAFTEEMAYLPNGWMIQHLQDHETKTLFEDIFVDCNYFRHGVRLPRTGSVIDVGANIGLFSLFVRQQCPDVPIYAFEPAPRPLACLEHNAAAYGRGIHVFGCGLADRAKIDRFTYYPHYSTQSGLSSLADAAEDAEMVKTVLDNIQGLPREHREIDDESLRLSFEAEELTCRFERLSDVLRRQEVERVGLLKIDVQRAELEVLQGIDEEDWFRIDQVVVEVHGRAETEEVASRLRGQGFTTTTDQDLRLAGTDRYNVYAVRPGIEGDEVVGSSASWGGEGIRWPRVEPTADGLKDHLARRLPEPMIPAAIHVLDELPLTPNGKIDRQRLQSFETNDLPERIGPRSPLERQLADLWSDVLDREEFSVDDNFFDVGGHSLRAMQLITRIRRDFEVDLSLGAFLDAPTIGGLSQAIAKRTADQVDEVEVDRILNELESK